MAAAKALTGDAVTCVALDSGKFRFAEVADLGSMDFLPGAAKYGDLPGLLALGVPGKLWLAGEGQQPPALLEQIYQRANATSKLLLAGDRGSAGEAVSWLLRQTN